MSLQTATRKRRIPLDDLRMRIAEALAHAVKSYNLPSVAIRLGLSQGSEEEAHRSKRLYVANRLQDWTEPDLLRLAATVVDEYGSVELADVLSELTTHADHRLSKLTRREILKVLDPFAPLFGDHSSDLHTNLGVIAPRWDVALNPDRPFRHLREEVDQHYIRNSDWESSELLEHCGALDCPQARFFSLIELLLHPLTRRSDDQQRLADQFNELLRRDGFGIVITGYESTHPVYGIQRLTSGVAGTPKNLIFASV
jgi:hypothetical protein